jgi:hypothetical protein
MPLVYLLYSERPMMVAHLIYGVCIGRFPAHYPGQRRAAEPPFTPSASGPVELAPAEPVEPAGLPPAGPSSINADLLNEDRLTESPLKEHPVNEPPAGL